MGREKRNTYHLDKPRGFWKEEAIAKVLDERFGRDAPMVAAECGVYLAWFSEWMLTRYPNLFLHLIDPYSLDTATWADSLAKSKLDFDPENMKLVKQAAIDRIKPFSARANWIFERFHEIAEDLEEGGMDWLFIDSDHTYKAMVRDLPLCWRLIGKGGVLILHDFKMSRSPRHKWGVTKAALEFSEKIGVKHHEGDGKTCFFFKD